MTDETQEAQAPVPAFDAAWIIARLRAGGADRDALLSEAYKRTFGTELGRVVLLNHLTECGIGRPFGPDMTDAQLRYSAGMHDAAVTLANAAGYDQVALAAVILTETLQEEPADERPTPGYVPDEHDDFE